MDPSSLFAQEYAQSRSQQHYGAFAPDATNGFSFDAVFEAPATPSVQNPVDIFASIASGSGDFAWTDEAKSADAFDVKKRRTALSDLAQAQLHAAGPATAVASFVPQVSAPVHVQEAPQPAMVSTPEAVQKDDGKKERRRLKNREAAQVSRERKKRHLQELESKVDVLTQQNDQLKKRIDSLERDNKSLERRNRELLEKATTNDISTLYTLNQKLQEQILKLQETQHQLLQQRLNRANNSSSNKTPVKAITPMSALDDETKAHATLSSATPGKSAMIVDSASGVIEHEQHNGPVHMGEGEVPRGMASSSDVEDVELELSGDVDKDISRESATLAENTSPQRKSSESRSQIATTRASRPRRHSTRIVHRHSHVHHHHHSSSGLESSASQSLPMKALEKPEEQLPQRVSQFCCQAAMLAQSWLIPLFMVILMVIFVTNLVRLTTDPSSPFLTVSEMFPVLRHIGDFFTRNPTISTSVLRHRYMCYVIKLIFTPVLFMLAAGIRNPGLCKRVTSWL